MSHSVQWSSLIHSLILNPPALINTTSLSSDNNALLTCNKNSTEGYVAPRKEHVSVYIIATVRANEFLIFAHHLMILYICTKICENISKCFRVIERAQSAYGNLPGGHNYMKKTNRVMQPFSAHQLMTLYICTKFQENISKGFKVIKGTHTEIYKAA